MKFGRNWYWMQNTYFNFNFCFSRVGLTEASGVPRDQRCQNRYLIIIASFQKKIFYSLTPSNKLFYSSGLSNRSLQRNSAYKKQLPLKIEFGFGKYGLKFILSKTKIRKMKFSTRLLSGKGTANHIWAVCVASHSSYINKLCVTFRRVNAIICHNQKIICTVLVVQYVLSQKCMQ